MSAQPLADPVELLLPDATEADLALAGRLTRALSIFSSDAVDSGSPSVHVQWESALDELGLYHAGTVGSLLQDLLIHVALEATVYETYQMLPVPRRTYAAAWSQAFATTTEEERRALGFGVPAAAAPPLRVLEGLVEALEKHAEAGTGSVATETEALSAQLWRIRYDRIRSCTSGEASSVAESLEALLGQLARQRGPRARALRTAALSDLVTLQLDLGQMASATETIRRAGPTAHRPADCQSPMDLVALMVRWYSGQGERPNLDAAAARCTALGTVPTGWEQVTGRPGSPASGGGLAPRLPVPLTRRVFGVTALVVSSIQPDGTLKVMYSDIAPGLTSEWVSWKSLHRVALGERGTPEHEVGCRAAPLLLMDMGDGSGGVAPTGASCIARRGAGALARRRSGRDQPEAPAAIAVQPILDGDGEPAGLVWIECPTRLIPTVSTREAVARIMGEQHVFASQAEKGRDGVGALAPRRPIHLDARSASAGEGEHGTGRARSASSDLRSAWETVLATLQLKTAERRWIAFHVAGEEGELQLVATGGDAGDRLGRATDEGTWAIRRSLRTGGAVRYGHDGAEVTMLHPGAISGAALPLHRGGRVIAVLSLESARRGDAREGDVDRWFETLQRSGSAVEAAMFSAMDRRVHDGGFGFDSSEPEFPESFEELCKLRRSPADVLVLGEVGTGRRTWTRLMHAGAGEASGGGTLAVRSAFSLDPEEIENLVRGDEVGTLAISDLEWLSPAAQAALLEVCSQPIGQRPRVLATMRSSSGGGAEPDPSVGAPGASCGEAPLHPQLLRLLGRVSVRRPSLRHRRHRIPSAAKFLLERISQREGVPTPQLEDAALAHLWRQPWLDNLFAVEAALYSLVMAAEAAPGQAPAGAALGVDQVEAALLDTGLESVPRLPSRSPSASDLAAALWTTRTATGRINKTRAALYLGWDPNTLSQRLKDGEIRELEQAREQLAASSCAPA